MAEYTSIKIRKDLNEKMQLIKTQNNYKSINELLDHTLDKTVNEQLEVIQEQPLFIIGDTPITWTTLKQCKNNDQWTNGNDNITVMFKDNMGVLLRFIIDNEVMVQYYHFI